MTRRKASVATIDPNAEISFEALVGAPLYALIEGWEMLEGSAAPSPELIGRVEPLLESVAWLAPTAKVGQLHAAIRENDPRALGTLTQLDSFLKQTFGVILTRCAREAQQNDWAAVRREAVIAARIAGALAFHSGRAHALFYVAKACRLEGDLESTVAAYEQAITAASASGEEQLVAVAQDNLGNALADLGRLDEALSYYEESLKRERRPGQRACILTNKANVLGMLGELRWAAHTLQAHVSELEQAGVSGQPLALALDNAASQITLLGEHATALSMYERAQSLFDAGDIEGRIINAQNRAKVHMQMENRQAAAEVFQEAHDLVFEHARRTVNPEHYRQGFRLGLAAALPTTDDVYALFAEMVRAKDANEWQRALKVGELAYNRARKAGDFMLALRLEANIAALLTDAGQVEPAIQLANQVVSEASERSLARAEMMALGTLASLSATGADIHQRLGALSVYARCVVLLEVHTRIVKGFKLDPKELLLETADTGTLSNELGIESAKYGADALATWYFQDAVNKAREFRALGQLANRLAGLLSVLAHNGQAQEDATVTDELLSLLRRPDLPISGQLIAHRALGVHYEKTDLPQAIHHRRQACAAFERLSQRMPAGTARANVDHQFPRLYPDLASLLRRSGDDRAAFEALQFAKGRRLIDVLAARASGVPVGFAGAKSAEEVSALLTQLSDVPTVLVDLAVENEGLTAYVLRDGHVRAVHVAGKVSNLTSPDRGDVCERQAHLVNLCRQEPILLDLIQAVASEGLVGQRLLIVPDRGLQNLPLHVIPVEKQPWCDQSSIGYIPAASVLRFTKQGSSANLRALVAGDSCGDLRHAAAECKKIASLLGTTALTGAKCTRTAIEERLRAGGLDVVHLAVHGRGDPRRGGRASLRFAVDGGGSAWTEFTELTKFDWRAKLVVLSGCGTGVSGALQGHQLVGTASAAMEAGASTVLASLWPVGDEACKIFMVAFYQELNRCRKNGCVDLRLVVDHARKFLRDWLGGRTPTNAKRRDGNRELLLSTTETSEMSSLDPFVSDALEWGPFMLVGDPILDVAGMPRA